LQGKKTIPGEKPLRGLGLEIYLEDWQTNDLIMKDIYNATKDLMKIIKFKYRMNNTVMSPMTQYRNWMSGLLFKLAQGRNYGGRR